MATSERAGTDSGTAEADVSEADWTDAEWNVDDLERDDVEDDCFHCGGDGWVECDDPIECTRHHRTYTGGGGVFIQMCRCSSCGGSGLAKDMTTW